MITVDYLRSHPHYTAPVVHVPLKWIWMKVPRAAGTTIMRHNIPPGYITAGRGYQTEEYTEWLGAITDADLADYMIWTVVRNPFDRLASCLSYFHVDPATFERDPDGHLADSPGFRVHSHPQHLYYAGADHVLRFEMLSADWCAFAASVGSKKHALEEMNSSTYERGNHRDFLTDGCREWAEEYYAQDLDDLGYEW